MILTHVLMGLIYMKISYSSYPYYYKEDFSIYIIAYHNVTE